MKDFKIKMTDGVVSVTLIKESKNKNTYSINVLSNNKYCMSHLGWVTSLNGLCPKCGSAMLEDEDLT